jgi:hypothetical protein
MGIPVWLADFDRRVRKRFTRSPLNVRQIAADKLHRDRENASPESLLGPLAIDPHHHPAWTMFAGAAGR